MYEGGKDTEGVDDVPVVPIWKRKGDVHDPGKWKSRR